MLSFQNIAWKKRRERRENREEWLGIAASR